MYSLLVYPRSSEVCGDRKLSGKTIGKLLTDPGFYSLSGLE